MERSEEDEQKWREQTFRPPLLPLSPFALCRYGERKGRGGKEGTFSPFFCRSLALLFLLPGEGASGLARGEGREEGRGRPSPHLG